jgi:hypothetical protein
MDQTTIVDPRPNKCAQPEEANEDQLHICALGFEGLAAPDHTVPYGTRLQTFRNSL